MTAAVRVLLELLAAGLAVAALAWFGVKALGECDACCVEEE
jgi:hypothetical protein